MAAGQAELDLPDPLEQTAPASAGDGGASAPTEDDLLAQLAGDEIDRLLAEAGVPPAAAPGVAPVVEAPVPDPDGPPIAPDEVEAELNAQLDDLFKKIDKPVDAKSETPAAESPSADVGPTVEAPATLPVKTPTTSSPTSDVPAVPASETPRPSADVAHPAEATPVELKFDNLPPARGSLLGTILLKPLELLSLPLASASDEARATVGKLAILTLFNAIGLIVYVLLFRGK